MANVNQRRISTPGSMVSTVPGVGAEEDTRPTAAEIAKRKPVLYRALARGYVDGDIKDEGDVFATTADQGSWMEKLGKGDADDALDNAVSDTQSKIKDDPDLTTFSKQALEARALELGLTSAKGLDKDDLIAAIRAASDNTK